jgi:hypothetical protein
MQTTFGVVSPSHRRMIRTIAAASFAIHSRGAYGEASGQSNGRSGSSNRVTRNPSSQPRNGTTRSPLTLQKNATVMERTTLRHLTPEEIELNQQESICRVELEELEMREAELELELEQDIDESRKIVAMYNLKVVYKELLAKHRELTHIKDAQITSVQRTLRARGGD